MFESGTTTVIVSNEDMNDIIKIVNSLEESKQKNKKEDFSKCY